MSMDLDSFATPPGVKSHLWRRSRGSQPATKQQKNLLAFLAREYGGLISHETDALEWLADEYTVNMDELTVSEFVKIKRELTGEV